MADSILGLALQGAQVSLAQTQVHQLGQIQQHLHHQQYQQQVQAALADVLFHTETRARQVTFVAQQEPFAAAILAHMWQASTGSVNAGMFPSIEGKRAWSTAWGQLETARSVLDRNPEHGQVAHRYLTDMAHVQKLGPAPAVEAVNAASEKAAKLTNWRKIAAIATPGVFFGGIVFGVIVSLFEKAGEPGASGCFPSLGFLGSLGALVAVFYAHGELVKVREEHERLAASLRAHQEFQQSEGGFLQALYDKCPWLARPLPPPEQLPPVSGLGAVMHSVTHSVVQKELVERQTVVARCKFCQGLTPVDGQTCQHCGAFKFV